MPPRASRHHSLQIEWSQVENTPDLDFSPLEKTHKKQHLMQMLLRKQPT